MDVTAPFRELFKRAAAEGAVLELMLRMLCEATPQLQSLAHAKEIASVEKEVVEHFRAHLSPEDVTLLETARQLRNKVLHADFCAARDKLKDAGEQPGTTGVRMLTVPEDGDLRAVLEAELATATPGRAVAEARSTKDGTVYGWLVELGGAGDFRLAVRAFQRALCVLDRLALVNAGEA